MNLFARSLRLLAGYLVGVLCFFLYDLFWGDPAGKALLDISRWLPLNAAYLAVILLLSCWVRFLDWPLLLAINGFLIGAISIFEAQPPYMDSMGDGGFILLGHLVVFLVANLIAISLSGTRKESVK